MAKGGFRPNAGRPRLTDAEKAERLLARRLAKRVGYTRERAELEAKAATAAAQAPAMTAKKSAAKPKAPARAAKKPVLSEPPPAAQTPATDQLKDRVEVESAQAGMSPLDYMLQVMRSSNVDPQRRDRMAIAAAPFFHPRKEPVGQGKREAADAASKKASGGKFGARPAPGALKLVNGG